MLTACSEQKISTSQSNTPAEATITTEKAELGTFGVDLTARDESVKPGDDFFYVRQWYMVQ